MIRKVRDIKKLILNNKKVIENYFFMTVLQVLNSLFYFLIYPFLIRRLGAESYGLYIFAMSIVTYFISLINFGFDMPGVKSIAQNQDNIESKTVTLSCIFTSKIYLEFFSTSIFILLVILLPVFRHNWMIFSICYLNTITNILFQQWYFQGIQKMSIVTLIQLFFKLVSLPFIFMMIHSPKDNSLFAIIVTSANILGSLVVVYIIRFKDKIKFSFVRFNEVKVWFKDGFPFFWTSAANAIKQQSTTVIVGTFFGMKDVALYDLAMKIFLAPTTLLVSINSALFPKMVKNINYKTIKRIINSENIIAVLVILFLILFGKYIIVLMGGSAMVGSYPLLIAISFSIFTYLTVGAFFSFILIPKGLYKYIAFNQTLAFFGFFAFCLIGLFVFKNILVIPLSITFSSIVELSYCYYLYKKTK